MLERSCIAPLCANELPHGHNIAINITFYALCLTDMCYHHYEFHFEANSTSK